MLSATMPVEPSTELTSLDDDLLNTSTCMGPGGVCGGGDAEEDGHGPNANVWVKAAQKKRGGTGQHPTFKTLKYITEGRTGNQMRHPSFKTLKYITFQRKS